MNFGQARRASGLTQEQVARLAGCTQEAVSAWERKEIQPYPRHLWSLARLLDNELGRWATEQLEEIMPGINVSATHKGVFEME